MLPIVPTPGVKEFVTEFTPLFIVFAPVDIPEPIVFPNVPIPGLSVLLILPIPLFVTFVAVDNVPLYTVPVALNRFCPDDHSFKPKFDKLTDDNPGDIDVAGVPDGERVDPGVPDGTHVDPGVPDGAHVDPGVPDDAQVDPGVPDGAHVDPGVPDGEHVDPLHTPHGPFAL